MNVNIIVDFFQKKCLNTEVGHLIGKLVDELILL